MDFLKSLFEAAENGAMTYDQFSQAVADKGYKLADLATGNYVSKSKYDDDLAKRDSRITELDTQIATRDSDLNALKEQLSNADLDNKSKVATLTTQLESLQGDYSKQKENYEAQIKAQSYSFAVKEYANQQKFSSDAAKRDFISQLNSKQLQMEGDKILGADDFLNVYKEANVGAFLSDEPAPDKPIITKPTEPAPKPEENAFANAFHFASVHPVQK